MARVASVTALMLSIIRPQSNYCSISRSAGFGGDGRVRMTNVAAPVAPAHVIDYGVRPLALRLERSDKRILSRHRHALVSPGEVDANGEFQHDILPPLVGRHARFGFFKLREPHLQNLPHGHPPGAVLF